MRFHLVHLKTGGPSGGCVAVLGLLFFHFNCAGGYSLVERRLDFLDLRAKFVTLNQNGEHFNVFKLIATCESILELSTNVCVAVAEEDLFARFFFGEDFDVHLGECFATLSFFSNLQLSVAFKDLYSQQARVVGLEVLLATTVDFNDQIFVAQILRNGNFFGNISSHNIIIFSLSFCYHNGFKLIARLDIAELFSVSFEEGSARE